MASPSTVLSLGFGGWGGVSLLPTLGFGAALAPPYKVCVTGRDYRFTDVRGRDGRKADAAGRDYRSADVRGSQGC